MATEEKNTCFVIMPISDVDGYDPGHFTRVYEHLIKPACEQAGFKPERADETPRTDVIMAGILKKIIACDIAICDLSSRNANVFYELGLRHAFNKKTVLIKDYKTPMPFDISGIRTLTYNENLRIDEVQKIIPEIARYLKETNDTDEKEANSMLQMLSIEEPATLPKKTTMNTESKMILNAIEQINQQLSSLTYIPNANKQRIRITELMDNNEKVLIAYPSNQGDYNNDDENNIRNKRFKFK